MVMPHADLSALFRQESVDGGGGFGPFAQTILNRLGQWQREAEQRAGDQNNQAKAQHPRRHAAWAGDKPHQWIKRGRHDRRRQYAQQDGAHRIEKIDHQEDDDHPDCQRADAPCPGRQAARPPRWRAMQSPGHCGRFGHAGKHTLCG